MHLTNLTEAKGQIVLLPSSRMTQQSIVWVCSRFSCTLLRREVRNEERVEG
jgi:hypothetical protein